MPDSNLSAWPEEMHSLRDWIQAGESETQEFKESTASRENATQTLCAFLNARGGRIIFGVRDDGTVPGQDVSDATMRKLFDTVTKIDPPQAPNIESVLLENGKSLVVVSVGKGRMRPYLFKGQAFARVGTSTTAMPKVDSDRLLLERLHASDRWELEETTLGVSDLDLPELRRMIAESVERGRAQDPLTSDPIELLTGLGLIKNGKLVNAAVALFGSAEKMLPDYSQCLLKLARFDGVIKGENISDEQQVHGNAFKLLREAEDFLRRNLPVRALLVPDKMYRQDSLEIPVLALREAITNALAHREYEGASGSISVYVFDDRVEIASSGPLHFGLSVRDLYRRHESMPWNPIMATVLYRRGVIDSFGSGTLRMVRLTEEAGLFPPDIIESPRSVTVDFPRQGSVPARLHDIKLDTLERRVLTEVARSTPVALRELLAALAPAGERDVRQALQRLRTEGLIAPSGHGRGARWNLVSPHG